MCKIPYLKILCLALCFIVIAANAEAKRTKITTRPPVSSITIDAKSGRVLAASNADQPHYPASLTKLMTLYLTFDALEKGTLKLGDKLKVSTHAAHSAPSHLGLTPGDTLTVKEAILAVIVKSANDCASVLAENLGKTEDNFAKTMTKTAQKLGMKNTTFKNASGLPDKQQKSTARDMAILGAAVYHHFPKYYHFFSTTEFDYNGQIIKTHNPALKTFKGADGMKTGYTAAAGYNIVTSAERNGCRVIAVTMGHKTVKDRDKKINSMMDAGLTQLVLNTKATDSTRHAAKSKIAPLPETKPIREVEAAPVEVAETAAPIAPLPEAKPVHELEAAPMEVAENPTPLEVAQTNAPILPGGWGIQLGAFSNYTKARNYALEIQNEFPQKYTSTNIDVEAAQKDGAVVYRSKIVGFEKNTAQNVCNDLKKSNKSCIVVAGSINNKLAMEQHNARQDHDTSTNF